MLRRIVLVIREGEPSRESACITDLKIDSGTNHKWRRWLGSCLYTGVERISMHFGLQSIIIHDRSQVGEGSVISHSYYCTLACLFSSSVFSCSEVF